MRYQGFGAPPLPTVRLHNRKWRGSAGKQALLCIVHTPPEITESLLVPLPPSASPPHATLCLPVMGNLVGFILMVSVHLAVERDICHFTI